MYGSYIQCLHFICVLVYYTNGVFCCFSNHIILVMWHKLLYCIYAYIGGTYTLNEQADCKRGIPWALAKVIKYGRILAALSSGSYRLHMHGSLHKECIFLRLFQAWAIFIAHTCSRDALLKKNSKKLLIYVRASSRSQPKKECARHNFRLKMELSFDIQDAKQEFVARIERIKRFLASSGS